MMNSMVVNKANIAKASLAGLLIALTPSVQAISLPSTDSFISAGKKVGLAYAFVQLVRFLKRKPTNAPNRYNLDELMAGQNVADNLWYLHEDGIWGHQESSSVLKASPENDHKLVFTEAASARGLVGNAATYAKPVAVAYALMALLNSSKDSIQSMFENNGSKGLEKEALKPFLAFMGAYAATQVLTK